MASTERAVVAGRETAWPLVRNLGTLSERLRRRREPRLSTAAFHCATTVKRGFWLTVLVILTAVAASDPHAMHWADRVGGWEKAVFLETTRLGKSEWWLVPSAVIGILVLFADWRRARRSLAAAWTEIGDLAGFFFFNVAAAGLVATGLKVIIGRARPLYGEEVLNFEPVSFGFQHLSFPSGHATTIAAALTAGALMLRGRALTILVLTAVAVVIAVSRVAARAHFPSDIIAGAFIGSAFTAIYACALARSGVAFQRQPDGSLMPKTTAIRSVFRRGRGAQALIAGLGAGLFGSRNTKLVRTSYS